jgi:hypothetical protein
MKTLLIGIAFAGAAGATEPDMAPHPALYSFEDVYRLTVAGPIAGVPGVESATDAPILPGAPVRVAAPQAQAAEPRFSFSAVPQPDKWILLLAGVALAGWVAHRRLVHSL